MKGYMEITLDHVHSLGKLCVQDIFGQLCRKMQLRSFKGAINANGLETCSMSQRST